MKRDRPQVIDPLVVGDRWSQSAAQRSLTTGVWYVGRFNLHGFTGIACSLCSQDSLSPYPVKSGSSSVRDTLMSETPQYANKVHGAPIWFSFINLNFLARRDFRRMERTYAAEWITDSEPAAEFFMTFHINAARISSAVGYVPPC